MLILTSNGLSSPELRAAVRPLLASFRRAALITTASVEFKERDKHIPRLTAELRDVGLAEVSLFDLDAQPVEELLFFDVVEILGGNPFYLLQAMRRTDCARVLQRIRQERALIGVSAGTMVLQRSIELAALLTPEMNENVGLTNWEGLALTDVEILPHYSRFCARFADYKARGQALSLAHGTRLVCLDDGQAHIEP